MGGFTFGNYYLTDSQVHRLDPRVKLNLMLLLMTAALIIDSFVGIIPVTIFVLIAWILARIPFRIAWRAMLPMMFLMLLPVLLNTLFGRTGEVLFSLGSLKITDTSVILGIFTACRLFLLFSGGALLTLTTTPQAIAYAIGEMLAPFQRFGLPAYEISLMLRIALRNIPDVAVSLNHIRKAQQARGAVFDQGGLIRRLRALVPCFVPLFAQAVRNADYLGMAMDSRCYHNGKRSNYRVYRVSKNDVVAIAASVVLLAASIAIRIQGL